MRRAEEEAGHQQKKTQDSDISIAESPPIPQFPPSPSLSPPLHHGQCSALLCTTTSTALLPFPSYRAAFYHYNTDSDDSDTGRTPSTPQTRPPRHPAHSIIHNRGHYKILFSGSISWLRLCCHASQWASKLPPDCHSSRNMSPRPRRLPEPARRGPWWAIPGQSSS